MRILYVNEAVLKLPEVYLLPERVLDLKPWTTSISFQWPFEEEKQVLEMYIEQTPCWDMIRTCKAGREYSPETDSWHLVPARTTVNIKSVQQDDIGVSRSQASR